jgi:hypothetical protein
MVLIGVSLASPRRALAADAGDGNDGSSVDDDGGTTGGNDASTDAAPVPVIACDGALCDTLQGRPACSVVARSAGAEPVDPTWIAAAAIVLGSCVARRVRRGASCPLSGGSKC